MAPRAADVDTRQTPTTCFWRSIVRFVTCTAVCWPAEHTRYRNHTRRLDINLLAMLRIAPPRVFQAVDPAFSEDYRPQ
jgi:hypothetical protein